MVIAGALLVSRYAQRGDSSGGARRLARLAVRFDRRGDRIRRADPGDGASGPGVRQQRRRRAVYAAEIVIGLPLALAFRIGLAPPAGAAWLPVFLAALLETAGFVCLAVGSRVAPLAIVSPFASLAPR